MLPLHERRHGKGYLPVGGGGLRGSSGNCGANSQAGNRGQHH
jgi:hypothetical protein